jgi:hypothetical protein
MMLVSSYLLALIGSVVWFTMAFYYFSFDHFSAAKLLVPSTSRGSPLFLTISAAVRFLGGLNGSFALLSLILFIFHFTGSLLFSNNLERSILLFILSTAHFSQLFFNIPVLVNGERIGESYWPVRKGPMRNIFIIDGLMCLVCLIASLLQYFH